MSLRRAPVPPLRAAAVLLGLRFAAAVMSHATVSCTGAPEGLSDGCSGAPAAAGSRLPVAGTGARSPRADGAPRDCRAGCCVCVCVCVRVRVRCEESACAAGCGAAGGCLTGARPIPHGRCLACQLNARLHVSSCFVGLHAQ